MGASLKCASRCQWGLSPKISAFCLAACEHFLFSKRKGKPKRLKTFVNIFPGCIFASVMMEYKRLFVDIDWENDTVCKDRFCLKYIFENVGYFRWKKYFVQIIFSVKVLQFALLK